MTQIVFAIVFVIGVAGIAYTAHGLGRLTDYFEEIYGYDRDPNT